MFTKLHSIRSSIHFPSVLKQRPSSFTSNNVDSDHTISSTYSHNSLSVDNISRQQGQYTLQQRQQQQQQRQYGQTCSQQGVQRHRTVSTPTTSFTETLKVISKQVQQDQFEDVFGSFFFTDKRCQLRAMYMAARLQQNIGSYLVPYFQHQCLSAAAAIATTDGGNMDVSHSFWLLVIDRFYTLNNLLFVVPSSDPYRQHYLSTLEQHLDRMKHDIGLNSQSGSLEVYFVLYYAIKKYFPRMMDEYSSPLAAILEKARKILAHCLESESKLGPSERDAMYIFHGLRAGFHGNIEPKVNMDDDDDDMLLTHLNDAVRGNKNLTRQPYVNPFEDDACIVDSDDDYDDHNQRNKSRQVDSGFYEGQ
ncbi:uncharacterized protein BX664DRAFT_270840 [Halteromyces radiatus]|uniref:uncharacterized protein n=1 Tax=Halteromyces radiatus TaxID=101107 RepID=UPI00221E86EC|nr:uncharacterized protein BX664DRAFT_270840 [Halteromyces radiatus]KAI8076875.1 hypothetical protein BX664DRAFT_270840 [Halteromyces radiatus]